MAARTCQVLLCLILTQAALASEVISQRIGRRDLSGRYFGGCNDAFSVFGFLAFLLALLDLVIELMNNNSSGRAFRNSRQVGSKSICHMHSKNREQAQEASLSAYIMFRSFLNAVGSSQTVCMERFLCEGSRQAASLGPVAQAVASVAGSNAHGWLQRIDPDVDVESAVRHGISMKNCEPYALCSDQELPSDNISPELAPDRTDPSKYLSWLRDAFRNLANLKPK